MPGGSTLENLAITETFYGWFTKTNEIINELNSTVGSGVSGAGISGDNLIITLIDGSTIDAGNVIGPQGVGIASGGLSGDNLIITLQNGATFDVGNVRGPQGSTGNQGPIGATGFTGNTGEAGLGVPTGGLIGYALVKKTNVDRETEWKDLGLQVKASPGQVGGWETKKIENILGEGPLTSGRNRFPRWSPNMYLSEVHTGISTALDGSTGFFEVAGYLGNSSGYDDGVTAGIKVLNFFESIKRFEGNTYFFASTGSSSVTGALAECQGRLLDAPPGFYWNRMKYFPTIKLQPIYVSNYSVIDQYTMYVTGYATGATSSSAANQKKRRGTYGFFGMLPINSFPSGTPESTLTSLDRNGFVQGSTCAFYFRPDDGIAATSGNVLAVTKSDANFNTVSNTHINASYTGDFIREVTPGRTGPIGLFSSAAGPRGISGGFTVDPGWYYIMTEFIPAAWFSIGSDLDNVGTGDAYYSGLHSDRVLFTHTDASLQIQRHDMFGLNGFELAPYNHDVGEGIPKPFTPTCYLGVPVVKGVGTATRDLQHPTGLPPHLWYNFGFSGGSADGRFVTGASGGSNSGGIQFGPHLGLHSYDVSGQTAEISPDGGIVIRAQNAEQGSAPRIAISVISTSNAAENLVTFEPGIKAVAAPSCIFNCNTIFDTTHFTDSNHNYDLGHTSGTGPDPETGECPIYCCPGTTYAYWNSQGLLNDAQSVNGNIDQNSAGSTGIFLPTAPWNIVYDFDEYGFTGGTASNLCVDFSCANTYGYVCRESHASCSTPGGCIPHGNNCAQYGSCTSLGALVANSDSADGGTTDPPSSRTISIFVNEGEQHHDLWFGASSSVTGSNHLIWHTASFGCTTGITFNKYEGP